MNERGDRDAKYEHFAFAADRARLLELKTATERAARTRTAAPLIELEAKYRDGYERRRAEAAWDQPLEPVIARTEAVLSRTARSSDASLRCADARRHGGRAPYARVLELVDAVEYVERIVHIPGAPTMFVEAVFERLAALFSPVSHRHHTLSDDNLDGELLGRFQNALELCADPWARNIGLGAQYDRLAAGPGPPPPHDWLIDAGASSTIYWARGVLASAVSFAVTDLVPLAAAIEGQDLAFVRSEQLDDLRDEIEAAEEDGEQHEYAGFWLVPIDSDGDGEAFVTALDAYAAAVHEVARTGGAIIAWTTKSGSL